PAQNTGPKEGARALEGSKNPSPSGRGQGEGQRRRLRYFTTSTSTSSNEISPTAPIRPMWIDISRACGGTLIVSLNRRQPNDPRHGPSHVRPTLPRLSS